jgi:hypothetical protein
LEQRQLEEFNESRTNWVPFLGDDLLVYMQYPWSSMTSLEACAKDIESKLSEDDTLSHSKLKELQSKFAAGDFVSFVNHWAGMFVLSLRRMKIRALFVARYLAKTKSDADMHPSEVSEDIGTALYGDLVGSTSYGYPINVMTAHEKREIAQCAKVFFEEAVKLSSSNAFRCKCDAVAWENQFMIGKCLEKVASTFCDEAFVRNNKGAAERHYEAALRLAMQNYSAALVDAKNMEQASGGKAATGGSSHGSLEVFYRISACRLKALLFSIRRVKEEQELAQREAIRIVSEAWFGDDKPTTSPSVWDAFVDCVKALMQCRKEEPKFHRAAFRLAQAFNWAPLFFDPDRYVFSSGGKTDISSIASGSLPCIEAGSCEANAAMVMESLFDKRRQQICAVWVCHVFYGLSV